MEMFNNYWPKLFEYRCVTRTSGRWLSYVRGITYTHTEINNNKCFTNRFYYIKYVFAD